MKKKILILNIEVSGMNKYLFAELRRRGWELIICDVPLPRRLRWWAKLRSFRLPVSDWKMAFDYHLNKLYKSSWCFRWRTRQCEKILKRHTGKFDLVINMTGMNAPFLDRSEFPNVKYIVVTSYTMALAQKYDEWCTYPHEYGPWLSLEKKLYHEAEMVLTTNDNVRGSLKKDYDLDIGETHNIGYGLTFDDYPEFEKGYSRKEVLFVGFDFKRKGGYVLLDAFKKVRQAIPSARLIIIGPNKDIYHIKQEGVEFLGPIKDREKVKAYFQQASLFAMPSLCEPFGLVFLEAMAYRMPCIGSTVDAMPEIIEDGRTGFLVAPNNVEQLVNALIRILNDEVMMRRMGCEGRERLEGKFSWKEVGSRVDSILSVITKKT